MNKSLLSRYETDYNTWINAIDALITNGMGAGIEILSDWPSRDLYDSGLTVREAARECLLEQDFLGDDEIEAILQ